MAAGRGGRALIISPSFVRELRRHWTAATGRQLAARSDCHCHCLGAEAVASVNSR
jgi:hypothetical protein